MARAPRPSLPPRSPGAGPVPSESIPKVGYSEWGGRCHLKPGCAFRGVNRFDRLYPFLSLISHFVPKSVWNGYLDSPI